MCMVMSECSGLEVFNLFLNVMKQTTVKYTPVITSALLLWAVLFFVFPHYQYFIDPDGTSYLTISARYAAGDYLRAINGLWSPWACWLTAILIKAGMAAIPASVIVNAFGATGFMVVAHALYLRFDMSRGLQWLFALVMVVFSAFAIFWQSFDDLWQCFFVLLILRIMLAERYSQRPMLWVLVGVVGGFSYFSKAYSLHFLVLSTIGCSWFLSGRNLKLMVGMVVVPIVVALIFSFPWIYALHFKYGTWGASTAGKLNISWYLMGHPFYKDGIDILVPPIYNNSVYYWEDPGQVNGKTYGFLDSLYLFGYQFLRVGYNGLMLLLCLLQLSVIFPVVNVYMAARLAFQKKFPRITVDEQVLYITVLLLPAGYLMVHLESRYLWLTIPPVIIVVTRFIQQYSFKTDRGRSLARATFAASLLLFPVWQLIKMKDVGKEEYTFAMKLKSAGLTGVDIVSNLHPRILSKACYFSGNRFYQVEKQVPAKTKLEQLEEKPLNTQRLVADIKKYGIRYYLYAPENSGKMENPGFRAIFYENLADSSGVIRFNPILQDAESGMTLYSISSDRSL
jgi:hypothetical protein